VNARDQRLEMLLRLQRQLREAEAASALATVHAITEARAETLKRAAETLNRVRAEEQAAAQRDALARVADLVRTANFQAALDAFAAEQSLRQASATFTVEGAIRNLSSRPELREVGAIVQRAVQSSATMEAVIAAATPIADSRGIEPSGVVAASTEDEREALEYMYWALLLQILATTPLLFREYVVPVLRLIEDLSKGR
jgi:hypothetical protein